MKPHEAEDDIRSIKILMERSSKFISLSGFTGVMAGLYALAGAYLAHRVVYAGSYTLWGSFQISYEDSIKLIGIALGVFILALVTGIWLTAMKAKRMGQKVWNPSSRSMMVNMAIPLFTGGGFVLILIYQSYLNLAAPVCLLFYGLSLIAGSHYTYRDIKWLGMFQILLGLTAAFYPGFGLLFWTVGFGPLHILYGVIMYLKYDR